MKGKIVFIVIAIVCLGVAFLPVNRTYSGSFSAELMNPVIEAGDVINLHVKGVKPGSTIYYTLFNEGLLYSEDKDIVYNSEFTKKLPTTKAYKSGLWELHVTMVDGEYHEDVMLSMQILSAVNWWLYILVFIVLLVIIHMSFRKFSDQNFHLQREKLQRFYEILSTLNTRDYQLATMYFHSLKESYQELQDVELSKFDRERVDALYKAAKARIRKLKL
jgi:hypothetical protein